MGRRQFRRVFKWFDAEGRCVEHVDDSRFKETPDLYDRDARLRRATKREVKWVPRKAGK